MKYVKFAEFSVAQLDRNASVEARLEYFKRYFVGCALINVKRFLFYFHTAHLRNVIHGT